MNWHTLTEKEVLEALKVESSTGLSSDEAKKRLSIYGPNEFKAEEPPSALWIFLRQFKDILIIILLIATFLSALVGEVFDAGLISLIVLFSTGLGFAQEYKAERAIEALKRMLSPTVTVLREGVEVEVAARDVVPGDCLLLEAGDRIPVDARVLESHSLMVDESSLTGESQPVEKATGIFQAETVVAERTNMLFAGTVVTYGRGKVVAVSTGMNTELGRIAREVGTIKEEKTPLKKKTEEIGRWLGAIALGICFAVVGVGIIREAIGGEVTFKFLLTMVMFAIALAVAAVPETLAAIVTGTLAIGMREMARRNALVRRMTAVETLGSVTVICSDKTGTITKGEMTVKRLYIDGGFVEVSGVGYEPKGGFNPEDPIKKSHILFKAGLLCNNSDLRYEEGRWSIKGDPTEGALLCLAAKAGLNIKEVRLKNVRVEEFPFSSERKLMTTVHEDSSGERTAYMKGAPEVVLERCDYDLKDNTPYPLREEAKKAILDVAERMAGDGLRVIALAMKRLEGNDSPERIEEGMAFLGLVGMIDPPRKEAIEAVKVCKAIKVKPVMITGDHKLTAIAVAREVGIFREGDIVLTGAELEDMTDEEFESIVERVSVYARVSPIDKLRIVKAWKRKGEIVAMTGDGVNDAPALKHADIGVAMGITGTEVTKEAADMILTDDNFATILKAIELGRWIYDNLKKYITYLLRANIIEVVVLGGVVILKGPEYLPLLPVAILYLNLATDGLPALALGVAPPDPDIMQRPPRNPKEGVFSWDVKTFILLSLFIEVPFFYYIFFHDLTNITHARTEIFFLFIIVELIIALNFRSMRYSIFKAPPHKWLTIAIIWEILLIILLIQFPSVRNAFGILKPSASDIGIILGFGAVVFISMEIVKAILKGKYDAGDAM